MSAHDYVANQAPPLGLLSNYIQSLQFGDISRATVEAALLDMRPDPTTPTAWAEFGDCLAAILDRVEIGDIVAAEAVTLLQRVFRAA